MARAVTIAVLALAVAAGCNADSDPEPERGAASEATTSTGELVSAPGPKPVVESCATRSEAEFGGAFVDPTNVVVGPFVLVGGARLTTAEVLASFDGQKFPVLVRAGHAVTLRVPEGARGHVSLGYGPLPQGYVQYDDGHPAVTFTACPPGGRSSSNAGPDEPVTFWSGFVFTTEPSCAPLDVYVDGEASPRRLEIPLGASC